MAKQTEQPVKETERKATSISEAEELQKHGWRVVDVKKTGFTKVYTLERV